MLSSLKEVRVVVASLKWCFISEARVQLVDWGRALSKRKRLWGGGFLKVVRRSNLKVMRSNLKVMGGEE